MGVSNGTIMSWAREDGQQVDKTAERNGQAADDVVGHRLSFTGNRFQIQSKDGKPLYVGITTEMCAPGE
jgi:hypothetical protein